MTADKMPYYCKLRPALRAKLGVQLDALETQREEAQAYTYACGMVQQPRRAIANSAILYAISWIIALFSQGATRAVLLLLPLVAITYLARVPRLFPVAIGIVNVGCIVLGVPETVHQEETLGELCTRVALDLPGWTIFSMWVAEMHRLTARIDFVAAATIKNLFL